MWQDPENYGGIEVRAPDEADDDYDDDAAAADTADTAADTAASDRHEGEDKGMREMEAPGAPPPASAAAASGATGATVPAEKATPRKAPAAAVVKRPVTGMFAQWVPTTTAAAPSSSGDKVNSRT
jgi:hypothetical protein